MYQTTLARRHLIEPNRTLAEDMSVISMLDAIHINQDIVLESHGPDFRHALAQG